MPDVLGLPLLFEGRDVQRCRKSNNRTHVTADKQARERGVAMTESGPGIPGWGEMPHVAFVITPIKVAVALPVEIIPGHILRRASQPEIEAIRAHVLSQTPIAGTIPYEFVSENGGAAHRSIDPADWRYFVIEVNEAFPAINSGVREIELASMLTDLPLDCPLFISTGGVSVYLGISGFEPFRNAMQHLGKPAPTVDAAAISEIRRLREMITVAHEDVARALDMFHRLKGISPDTPLRVLGLFAIIESLLTHKPNEGGFDSLGHQVETKMQLLNRRFDRPLSFESFGGTAPAKVWKKLYACRSSIAHGGALDFSAGELKCLQGLDHVEPFLVKATRAVVRHALAEPDLISDLRAC